jgi:hypothetical protein
MSTSWLAATHGCLQNAEYKLAAAAIAAWLRYEVRHWQY